MLFPAPLRAHFRRSFEKNFEFGVGKDDGADVAAFHHHAAACAGALLLGDQNVAHAARSWPGAKRLAPRPRCEFESVTSSPSRKTRFFAAGTFLLGRWRLQLDVRFAREIASCVSSSSEIPCAALLARARDTSRRCRDRDSREFARPDARRCFCRNLRDRRWRWLVWASAMFLRQRRASYLTTFALEAHDVVAAIDVDGFAGDAGTAVGKQKRGGAPTSAGSTLRFSGARSTCAFSMSPSPEMPRAASVLIGPAEMALTRMFLRAEIVGEVAHAGFERGFRDAHDVVFRYDFFRAVSSVIVTMPPPEVISGSAARATAISE